MKLTLVALLFIGKRIKVQTDSTHANSRLASTKIIDSSEGQESLTEKNLILTKKSLMSFRVHEGIRGVP